MDEFEKEIKSEVDKIPQALRDEFAVRLKLEFSNLANLMQQVEAGVLTLDDSKIVKKRQECLNALENISDEFFKAGGDDRYWNALSVAVDTGIYDKLYHEP